MEYYLWTGNNELSRIPQCLLMVGFWGSLKCGQCSRQLCHGIVAAV